MESDMEKLFKYLIIITSILTIIAQRRREYDKATFALVITMFLYLVYMDIR